MASDPNVVLVCVDCLRADFTFEDHAPTPTLDRLAREGLACTQMHSTTTTTTPSVASLLTGTYNETNGVNSLQVANLQDEVDTAAEVFGREGYETSALVTGPLVEDTGLDRGFDHYEHRGEDRELLGDWREEALEHVGSLAGPFLLYVHLWELHKPIEVPPAFDEPSFGEEPYARQLAALDEALAAFVEELPDDTIVAVHGDHGESISFRDNWPRKFFKKRRRQLRYERGIDTREWERSLNRSMARLGPAYPDHFLEDGHGEGIWDFMTNVPLILWGPGVPSARIDAQCRQIDVLPTLAELVLGKADEDVFDGRPLLPPEDVEDRPAYVRACGTTLAGDANWHCGIRHDGYKYITYPNRDWSPELYRPAEDPSELERLDDDSVMNQLDALLPDAGLLPAEQLQIQERLTDLGYL